jgi:hypothetical protein
MATKSIFSPFEEWLAFYSPIATIKNKRSIISRPSRLLYEEGVSTVQDFFSMTNTISHELVSFYHHHR